MSMIGLKLQGYNIISMIYKMVKYRRPLQQAFCVSHATFTGKENKAMYVVYKTNVNCLFSMKWFEIITLNDRILIIETH